MRRGFFALTVTSVHLPSPCSWQVPHINMNGEQTGGDPSTSKAGGQALDQDQHTVTRISSQDLSPKERFRLKESLAVPLLEIEMVSTLHMEMIVKRETEKEEVKKTGKQYPMKYQLNYFSCKDAILLNHPS